MIKKIKLWIIDIRCLVEYNRKKIIENSYRFIANKIPHTLMYFIIIDFWAKTTTGIYGNTDPHKLTVNDALHRFQEHEAK